MGAILQPNAHFRKLELCALESNLNLCYKVALGERAIFPHTLRIVNTFASIHLASTHVQ